MPAARATCRRRRHTGGSGYGRPARVMTKLALALTCIAAEAIKNTKKLSGCPHSVSPLLPTPATASSWGWQLHRRVQLYRHHFYGNVFERSAASAQRVLPYSRKSLTAQVAPQRSEGVVAAGAGSLPTFWQQKVGRLADRDPPSGLNCVPHVIYLSIYDLR